MFTCARMLLFPLFAWVFSPAGLAAVVNQRAAGRDDLLEPAFRLVREAVQKDEVPGAIALVARGGTILRQEAYGLRDIENQLPFTTNTLCWIASITKPVTLAAAMTLVDAGKHALDNPVEKYLPEFGEQKDTNGLHHAFTIRHLMSHTSGLVPNPPTRRSGWLIGGPLDDFWLQQKLPEIVFLHEGSSGTLAWADPKTRVIGILFLQYRDQKESDVRLRKAFRESAQKAFANRP